MSQEQEARNIHCTAFDDPGYDPQFANLLCNSSEFSNAFDSYEDANTFLLDDKPKNVFVSAQMAKAVNGDKQAQAVVDKDDTLPQSYIFLRCVQYHNDKNLFPKLCLTSMGASPTKASLALRSR